MNGDDFTIDGRFTNEGFSMSVYDNNGHVVKEAWFTWDEVESRKGEGSDLTMSLNTSSDNDNGISNKEKEWIRRYEKHFQSCHRDESVSIENVEDTGSVYRYKATLILSDRSTRGFPNQDVSKKDLRQFIEQQSDESEVIPQ